MTEGRTPTEECRDVADKAIKNLNVATSLYYGWDRLPKGIRDDAISKISNRISLLQKGGHLSKNQEKEFQDFLKDTREAPDNLVAGALKDHMLDLAINTICDCHESRIQLGSEMKEVRIEKKGSEQMPRVNPHASALRQDAELKGQQEWLKEHGFKSAREAQEAGH